MQCGTTATTHAEAVLNEIKPGQWVDHYPAHGGGDRYGELITEMRGGILITRTGRRIHRSAVGS
ncbi:hypothetical protein D2E76_15875 [Mycobacteroides abscessus]|uniref:Uncharacterized protein n=1 Tax=Mycobacteroides abscessus TaxID=36809 RepID=A0ABD7HMP9_9MYCO|nr:hypothetical protein [Mycobacteroides abscessus]RIT36738.1 hypothetical protein D2E76_15875 [Mycobacteroides abscessus]